MVTIKSKKEIEQMREACKLTAQVHEVIKEAIRPGISTYELDQIAEKFIRANGGIPSEKNYPSGVPGVPDFPGSICASINDEVIHFNDNKGYIEKDWGCSFPKSYIWGQGNNFKKTNSSFMFSIADIPLKLFTFKGFICVLLIGNKEFKFTTYNNAKLVECQIKEDSFNITFEKNLYLLNIKSEYDKGLKLAAPVKGKMTKDIFESISTSITVTLKKGEEIIFSDTSNMCGLEIVQK